MRRPFAAPTLDRTFETTLCMHGSMNDTEYHARADALLARIESQVDEWLQRDVIDIDAQRTGGLLELQLPDGSKLVVNKQPPLHEVWLASRAGGYHFAWRDGAWYDSKSGLRFEQVFDEQASAQSGQLLRLA